MMATPGSLEVAAQEIPKYLEGTACIGKVPESGPLADLLAAQKRVRDAKIDGVTSVATATYPAASSRSTSWRTSPGSASAWLRSQAMRSP